MDCVLNRYIAIIASINAISYSEEVEKEKIVRNFNLIEKKNLKDFLFPLCCYIDELRRNIGVHSNLTYMEYGIACFGSEFNKKINQRKSYKLKILYELINLFRKNNLCIDTYKGCGCENIKIAFRIVRMKKILFKVFYRSISVFIILAFWFTQFYIRYVF